MKLVKNTEIVNLFQQLKKQVEKLKWNWANKMLTDVGTDVSKSWSVLNRLLNKDTKKNAPFSK